MQVASSKLPLSLHQLGRRRLLASQSLLLSVNPPSRLVVAGGPRAGKSTLAAEFADRTKHRLFKSDDLAGLGWHDASAMASLWLNQPAPWVCEGVAMPRALRKWLAANPEGAPADLILYVHHDVIHRSPGQRAMAKGCETVMREIATELRNRGVEIIEI